MAEHRTAEKGTVETASSNKKCRVVISSARGKQSIKWARVAEQVWKTIEFGRA